MNIKQIMSRDVEVVAPDTLLHEVAQRMRKRDCGAVLVATDDKLVGVITDRDIAIRCVAESHHPAETTAQQVMSPEILYCRDTDEAEDVARNMSKNKVRRLVVLDENKRMVGIVSLGDLAIVSPDHTVCGTALGLICHPALVAVPMDVADEPRPGTGVEL